MQIADVSLSRRKCGIKLIVSVCEFWGEHVFCVPTICNAVCSGQKYDTGQGYRILIAKK